MTTPPPPAADAGHASGQEAKELGYVRQLAEDERAGARIQLSLGPWTLFTIIGTLQMAMRHPDFSPVLAAKLHKVIDQAAPAFDHPVGRRIIAKGNDPAYDVMHTPAARAGFDAWLHEEYGHTGDGLAGVFCANDMAAAFAAGRLYAAGRPQMTP